MNKIGISNIKITDNKDDLFTVDNYSYFLTNNVVKISFDVDFGEVFINKIKYTLCTMNDLVMMTKTDINGTSRGHSFVLIGDHGGLYYGTDMGDCISVRIDIENMEGEVFSFYAESFIPAPELNNEIVVVNPGLSRISASQRTDGSQMVDIHYDYFGLSGINASNVKAFISTNDGGSWEQINQNAMRGDIGSGIMPGCNRILWSPLLTLSNSNAYPNSIDIKLTLSDIDGNSNIGVQSTVVILDLYKPEVAIRKLSLSEEQLIGGNT
jgi:hypothetical protein